MRLFNLKRRGTCSVCPVLWEEGQREVPPYPEAANIALRYDDDIRHT